MNAEEFCDKLEGYYDSWKQASADPARYAHVKIRWTRLGPKQLESKQWYPYLGEEKPYRKRWHKVYTEGDHIRVENWGVNWQGHRNCCDMIFTLENGIYKGKVATDECIVNGGFVESMVEFDGTRYKSRDRGWTANRSKKMWGSDVIYEFLGV